MSDVREKPEEMIYLWWKRYIQPRDVVSRARALSAILRRGDDVTILCQPEVQQLFRDLGGPTKWRADRLAGLLGVLANVREYSSDSLPKRLGGAEPLMSALRFEKLMTAEEAERVTLMRRAILMLKEPRCNVASLARDMLYWNDYVRTRWCFEYFGDDTSRAEKAAS